MTPRLLASAKVRLAAVIFLGSVGLIAMVGCDPRALAFFLQPNDPTIEPPYKGSLQNKKVVVLCHVLSEPMASFPSLEHDLSREFCTILREKKIKKMVIVDPDKVATWVEAHPTSTDPADVANDFSADIVIDLEVEQYRLSAPGDMGLLRGESKVRIKAFEMKYPTNSKDKPLKDQPKEADVIYEDFAETTFPNRGHIPVETGSSQSKFQRTFLRIVAKEVSWHFVGHAQDDVIQNSRIEP